MQTQTTTFRQYVDSQAYWLTIPLGRLEGIMEKIDEATAKGDILRAKKLIKRYIVDAPCIFAPTISTVKVATTKKDRINELLTKAVAMPARDRIALLQEVFPEMSYNNARYYVVLRDAGR
jgi:hypothetical protein